MFVEFAGATGIDIVESIDQFGCPIVFLRVALQIILRILEVSLVNLVKIGDICFGL